MLKAQKEKVVKYISEWEITNDNRPHPPSKYATLCMRNKYQHLCSATKHKYLHNHKQARATLVRVRAPLLLRNQLPMNAVRELIRWQKALCLL